MDESKYRSWIKTFKIVGIGIGLAFVLLGVVSFILSEEEYLSMVIAGISTLLGLFLISFSYMFSLFLTRQEEEKQPQIIEAEEEHDVGL